MDQKGKAASKPLEFRGLTAAESPIMTVIVGLIADSKALEIKLSDLAVKLGLQFIELKSICKADSARYSVILPGTAEPQKVSRFEAAYNSAGISRATAFRYIRAAEEFLKQTNPIPDAVLAMASGSGVISDPTTELAKDSLASAFLAAGLPKEPTPLQVMSILADACERMEEAPADRLEEFKKLITKASDFALANHLPLADILGALKICFSPEAGWATETDSAGNPIGFSAAL